MNRIFISTVLLMLSLMSFAQILESEISGNGICFPQLTTVDRDLITPIVGQCIFNTDISCIECYLNPIEGWQSMPSFLTDRDRDTQVLVEKQADEDIIYLVAEGQNLLTARASEYGDARLEPTSFGFNAAYRANLFLGAETGHDISSGIENVIIGSESAVSLSTGSLNTTLGTRSGSALTSGNSNTFLGAESGLKNSAGFGNTYVGSGAGKLIESGNYNTNIGYRVDGPVNGGNNVFIGALAGEEIHNANNNVYIGVGSGSDADGDHNVFIGRSAGYNFNTNSKLVIESDPLGDNNSRENSLIYGDFENDFVTINSTLNVSRILKLQPLETEPACDEEAFGSIYMNAFENTLKLCTSVGWKSIALEP